MKPVTVLGEYAVHSLHLRRHLHRRKPQKKDTGVMLPSEKDQVAEVLILGDEHPVFRPCNGQHHFIRQIGWMVHTYNGDVMGTLSKIRDKPAVRALVEQKPHAGLDCRVLRARRPARPPTTRARA